MSNPDYSSLYQFLHNTPESGLRKMLADPKTCTDAHFSLLMKCVRSGDEANFCNLIEKAEFPKVKFSPGEQKIKEQFWADCVKTFQSADSSVPFRKSLKGISALANHRLLAIRINTSSMETILALFTALGVQFREKKVSKAGKLVSGMMGDLEVLVSDSLSAKQAGQPLMSVRLQVENLDKIWEHVKTIPNLECVMDLQELPDGKTAVVLDPDGRAFELTEPWPESPE